MDKINNKTPKKVVTLLGIEEAERAKRLAKNPNTPPEILEELLKDSTLKVRGAARKTLKDLLKISKRE